MRVKLEKRASIIIEYNTSDGRVWVWHGSKSLAAIKFVDIGEIQRADLCAFFNRRLTFKKEKYGK
jgi:hypothetical protein